MVSPKETDCYVEAFLSKLQAFHQEHQQKCLERQQGEHNDLHEGPQQPKQDLKRSQAKEDHWRRQAARLQKRHLSLAACHAKLVQDYLQAMSADKALQTELARAKASEAQLFACCVDICMALEQQLVLGQAAQVQSQYAFAAYAFGLEDAIRALQAEEEAHRATAMTVQDLIQQLLLSKKEKVAAAAATAGAIKEARRWKALYNGAASPSVTDSVLDSLTFEALELLEPKSQSIFLSRSCARENGEGDLTPPAKQPSCLFNADGCMTPDKTVPPSRPRRTLTPAGHPESASKAQLPQGCADLFAMKEQLLHGQAPQVQNHDTLAICAASLKEATRALKAEKEAHSATSTTVQGLLQELDLRKKEKVAASAAMAGAIKEARRWKVLYQAAASQPLVDSGHLICEDPRMSPESSAAERGISGGSPREAAVQWEAASREENALRLQQQAILASLRKAIKQLCTCPLTLQVMEQPVLGADFYTYERAAISTWLQKHKSSPFTRAPMAAVGLRPNKIVEELLEVMKENFPEDREPSLAPEMPPVLVRQELIRAIRAGDEELVLELLARPIEDGFLNDVFKHNEESYTILQLALLYQLPEAATAVARRLDFRRVQTKSTNGILAIHLAGYFGYAEVCEAIRADVGTTYLDFKSKHEITIVLPNGEPLFLAARCTAAQLLRQRTSEQSFEPAEEAGEKP